MKESSGLRDSVSLGQAVIHPHVEFQTQFPNALILTTNALLYFQKITPVMV